MEEWNAALKDGVRVSTTPTIGDAFPNLVGATQTTNEFDLHEYLGDSWGVVFMHPGTVRVLLWANSSLSKQVRIIRFDLFFFLRTVNSLFYDLAGDFTLVCASELGRAAALQDEFAKRGAKMCGFSCNDSASHLAWIEDIQAATGASVDFPLFCDPDRTLAISLGILDANNKDSNALPLTVRSVYILKPDKSIALMISYPASTGRNFDEILRALDSLQLTAYHAVATPADWNIGDCGFSFEERGSGRKVRLVSGGLSAFGTRQNVGQKLLALHPRQVRTQFCH